ncbi:wall-associated receptor kinase 3 [Eucalyptus grandis]|uniref:wall-associated receptor kinase 3 n=1 Tax=Eucalyptus grandis TaxID=71139 RepID=UPI00192EE749|nr:wall-associated receptor kinase 3 [Eucalyptus grandis]
MKIGHWLLTVAVAWWFQQGSAALPRKCTHQCGDVTVPFPFGLEPNCSRSTDFLLDCTNIGGSGFRLMLGNLTILKISVGDSTMVVSLPEAYQCYDQNGILENRSMAINLPPNPRYRFSETQNKLIVVGCNALAVVDEESSRGCASYCSSNVDFAKETTCSGQGCCQASIPGGLGTFNISLSSIDLNVSKHDHCARAFMVDNRPFNISNLTLPTFQDVGNNTNTSLVLDWMVESDDVCEKARSNLSSYACGKNTDCRNFGNGPGYRCVCRDGYNGNPYNLSKGCKAICSFGKTYKGKKNNKDRCPIAPGVIAGAAIAVSVFGIITWLRLGHVEVETQRSTLDEMEESSCNNAKSKSSRRKSCSVYGGTIAGDIVVVVKKPQDEHKSIIRQDFQDELEFLMEKSHKNMVKLKGICLETEIPLLVYEYIPNGTLFKLIQQNELTWEQRFKIAAEAALALNHMHSKDTTPNLSWQYQGDTLSDVINFESASEGEMEKIQTIAKIAVGCLDQYGANRLAMSDVVEQLANVYLISTDKAEDEEKEEDEETKREVHAEELSSCLSCLGMDSCI